MTKNTPYLTRENNCYDEAVAGNANRSLGLALGGPLLEYFGMASGVVGSVELVNKHFSDSILLLAAGLVSYVIGRGIMQNMLTSAVEADRFTALETILKREIKGEIKHLKLDQ